MLKKANLPCLMLLMALLVQGCAFFKLNEELKELEHVRVVSGSVLGQTHKDKSVLILLFERNAQNSEVAQASIFKPGLGRFVMEATTGDYYLFAFEDLNNNLSFDENEPAGFYGTPNEIKISEKSPSTMAGFDITLTTLNPVTRPLSGNISISPEKIRNSFVRIGQVIQWDDPLIGPEYGRKGYWEPLTFIREVGFCIFFEEPYDPRKIPVLIIHGAVGTPLGWEKIVDCMDRERFQAWFYYYPSGLALEKSSKALNQMLAALHRQYGFQKMHVIANSMGGLVARSFILLNHYEDHQAYLNLFISISTPWNGHKLSEKGVENAPAAVPSWHDMIPNSEFIQNLYKRKLPSFVEHHLVFSYKGECSLFLGNNDGTVEIASQLDLRAQNEAVRISGFNEDHGTILGSEEVLKQISQLLSEKE